jgi:hypothetical protein
MPGVIPAPSEVLEQSGPGDFPLDALPPILREMASAIDKVSRVPLDMVGPCLLATASACLGQGIEIRSAPGMQCAGNLFLLLVKPSGAGGSVAYRFATAPLHRYQNEAIRAFKEVAKPKFDREKATLQADYEKALSDRKTARKNDDVDGVARAEEELDRLQIDLAAVDAQLKEPIILLTDSTAERIPNVMVTSNETVAHFDSDAADTIAGILGVRYGNGDHTSDSIYLKAYSREALSISRQGSKNGGPINTFLSSPCLTAFWIVTPDIAKKILASERMLRGGLLPRFLVVSSKIRPQPWTLEAQEIPRDVAQRYELAAFALLNNYRNRALGELEPIDMEAEAWDLFADHYSRYCERFDPDFSAFDARHTENAVRLALVIHAWSHIEFPPSEPSSVTGHKINLKAETARAALRLLAWFASHQSEMLAPQREALKAGKFDRLQKHCSRKTNWIVSSRDLITAKIALNSKEAEAMFAEWETQGQIVREPDASPSTSRRPKGLRFRVLSTSSRNV